MILDALSVGDVAEKKHVPDLKLMI